MRDVGWVGQARAVSACLPVLDGRAAILLVGQEQLPHAERVLDGPVGSRGGPGIELTHEAQGLTAAGAGRGG